MYFNYYIFIYIRIPEKTKYYKMIQMRIGYFTKNIRYLLHKNL